MEAVQILEEQGSGTQNLAGIHYNLSPNIRTFPHWCHISSILHLYVSIQSNDNSFDILQVAQLTYPVLLARYSTILTAYSQHIQRSTEGKDRLQLDETLCVLEVCSAMKIAPAVADAAAQSSSQQQVTPVYCPSH